MRAPHEHVEIGYHPRTMFALLWIGFIIVVLVLMALDLGLIGRKAHVIGMREALLRVAGWVTLAMAFNVLVYFMYENDWLHVASHMRDDQGNLMQFSGRKAAIDFFTGYLVEQSLSIDNMMVIAMIFAYFRVPQQHQHRILFWGVLGAFVLRGVMIGLGAALIHRFEWVIYIFGALLLITAVKMLITNVEEIHPERNLAVRLARRLYPVTTEFHGGRFFVHINGGADHAAGGGPATAGSGHGRKAMTPLFLALILVETSDVMFAIDSIPAIFAITRDPFIVFTSNIFAVLGLRSLYFALAGMIDRFRYLKPSLVFLLAFIGVKMLLSHVYEIPTVPSLAIIGAILAIGIVASVLADRRSSARVRLHR
jgi:tellurite resistance protein TerC